MWKFTWVGSKGVITIIRIFVHELEQVNAMPRNRILCSISYKVSELENQLLLIGAFVEFGSQGLKLPFAVGCSKVR